MHILLTGGTGFIGRQLVKALLAEGFVPTVLTRQPERVSQLFGSSVAAMASLDEWGPDLHFDAVINLAGEPIVGKRWSENQKKVLSESRVDLTDRLVAAMSRARRKPTVLISGSAIGVYGSQADTVIDESFVGNNEDGFGKRLCVAWEASALKAEALGVRVFIVRTGLVIGRDGGFLQKMLLPFKLALGGPLGDGRQWMPWIHIDDHVALTLFMLKSANLRGVFNATAPNPVTNEAFTKTLAGLLRRPAFFRVPAWLLKAGAGEMAELMLGSQRVVPERALAAGFKFRFETLEPALRDVLGLTPVT